MIMAMIRPETEMKDSGIECIESIPKGWITERIKNLFSERNEKVDDAEPNELLSVSEYYGVAPRSEKINSDTVLVRAESLQGYKRCEKNDLVSNIMLAWKGAMGISQYRGVVSPSYCVYTPKKGICSQYYHYLFRTDAYKGLFKKYSTGIIESRLRLYTEQFFERRAIVPPLSEQQAIADYLDETCSKIDEIIAEAKASIDEYEKLKQATIDENILGYDSVHIKLRQLGSLKNGLNFSHSDDVANIKFLGVGCFKDNMILSEVDDFADEHIDFEISEEYLLSNGDIVFVRSNGSKELVGRSIMVENIDYPVTFSGFCIRFRNMHTELVDNRFLLYYFRTTHFKQSLLKYSNDSTNINNLNQEMLNAIRINAPVIAEQKLLVKKMEDQIFVFDSLITEKESLINDLEAYKKSLIYEVVTGKRRVV